MTAKEKRVYQDWNRKMSKKLDERNEQFELMQKLYEEKGGGKATCSLEYNLDYLLTSGDERTRDRAINIYRRYCESDAQNKAMFELAQGFADIK
ncbi:MAG: hypothetical protein RR893_11640 [Clostridia bacterium]